MGGREFPQDCLFAAPARADVRRSRRGISADARDQDETGDAGRGCTSRDHLSAADVHRLERQAAPLDIGRNRVDHGLGSGDGGGDRGLVAHVSVLDGDPAQTGGLEDAPRPGGMADRDADTRSIAGETPHQPPAQETRAAEDHNRGHGMPLRHAGHTQPAERRALAPHLRPCEGVVTVDGAATMLTDYGECVGLGWRRRSAAARHENLGRHGGRGHGEADG